MQANSYHATYKSCVSPKHLSIVSQLASENYIVKKVAELDCMEILIMQPISPV